MSASFDHPSSIVLSSDQKGRLERVQADQNKLLEYVHDRVSTSLGHIYDFLSGDPLLDSGKILIKPRLDTSFMDVLGDSFDAGSFASLSLSDVASWLTDFNASGYYPSLQSIRSQILLHTTEQHIRRNTWSQFWESADAMIAFKHQLCSTIDSETAQVARLFYHKSLAGLFENGCLMLECSESIQHYVDTMHDVSKGELFPHMQSQAEVIDEAKEFLGDLALTQHEVAQVLLFNQETIMQGMSQPDFHTGEYIAVILQQLDDLMKAKAQEAPARGRMLAAQYDLVEAMKQGNTMVIDTRGFADLAQDYRNVYYAWMKLFADFFVAAGTSTQQPGNPVLRQAFAQRAIDFVNGMEQIDTALICGHGDTPLLEVED